MEKKPVIQIAAGEPPANAEDVEKYYSWLENVHIPNLFKYKGLTNAANYRRIEVDHPFKTSDVEYPYYITVFEYEDKEAYERSLSSPEVEYAVGVGLETWGPQTGRKKLWLATYEQAKRWSK